MNKDALKEKIFDLFHQKLSAEQIYQNNEFEEDILTHYNQILEILTSDYDNYRKYTPRILHSLESNNLIAISYSVLTFMKLLNKVLANSTIANLDLSPLKQEIPEEATTRFISLVEKSLRANNRQRISEFKIDTNNLSNQEIREIISLIVSVLQANSEVLEWSSDIADSTAMQLPLLRHLSNTLNNPGLFYLSIGVFIDRLNSSEYYQAVRDLSEEIIASGFNDGMAYFGFFNAFRCYAGQSSAHVAILFANLSLYSAIKRGKPILDMYVQEMLWQTIKYYRNIGFYDWAINIYKSIPDGINFTDYGKRSIDHTYFTCLFYTQNKDLPNLILDYLHREREKLFDGGIHETLPWLITLYNIRKAFPNADFTQNGLAFYMNVFEQIVPESTYKKYKEMISGNSENFKDYLKKSLIKLDNTRNYSDVLYDNDKAILIASKLIPDSINRKDPEGILLAMLVKSDFSLVFKPEKSQELLAFEVPDGNVDRYIEVYGDIELMIKSNFINNKSSLIWLATGNENVYQLSFFDRNYSYAHLENWNWKEYGRLRALNYFSSLGFEDTKKDNRGTVREIFEEEYLEQAGEIINSINFCNLDYQEDSSAIYIIKDMSLAIFPHNLFLDNNNSFVHLKCPITNVLSTEWYFSNNTQIKLSDELKKSIWIPTEAGDLTLNHLFSSIENDLKKYKFLIYQNPKVDTPVNSALNIICSHGAEDIALNQIIYPNEHPLINLNHIIGKGEILIFFVCHSGSYKNELLRNSITSIVKTYIMKGYKAVIAPFWALHINVPRIWLPSFLDALHNGDSIDLAVFKANKEVYNKYPTPAAWAAMHLYGNPHIIIGK